RARGLLANIVTRPGDHFTILEQLVRPAGDADLFLFLHNYASSEAESPWRVLNRDPRYLARSVAIIKELFAPTRKEGWSVPLLDLLQEVYYEQEATGFFNGVLLPIVQKAEERNAVRRELLGRVAAGKFPRASHRWEL